MIPDTAVDVLCSLRQYGICHEKVEQIARATCSHLRLAHFNFSVNFVSLKEIRKLNKDFRNIDKPTDVLAFPLLSWAAPCRVDRRASPFPYMLGDIVLCPAVAVRNARRIDHDLNREVCFLLVHGILHLCGFDHQTPEDATVMEKKQRTIMKLLGEGAWRSLVAARLGETD